MSTFQRNITAFLAGLFLLACVLVWRHVTTPPPLQIEFPGLSQEFIERERENASISATSARMEQFKTALSMYVFDTGSYPTTAQGLAALEKPPTGVTGWDGPYTDDGLARDAWGNAYVYEFPSATSLDGKGLCIWSLGPDGVNGTDDDIVSR